MGYNHAIPSGFMMQKPEQKLPLGKVKFRQNPYLYSMPSSFTTYQEVQIPESGDSANSRVWISDLNGDGHMDCEEEILQIKDYYPFGMPHDLAETADLPSLPYRDSDPFTYNDKEYEDRVTRMYDYHARWYDAALGRWGVVDPLAEDAMQIDKSPYAYVWNNPVNLTDPDGRCPWCIGAIVGAAIDYGLQVADNLAEGRDLGEALTDVDGSSIGISAALGATGVGLLSKAGKVVKTEKRVQKAAETSKNVKKGSKYEDVTKSSRGKHSTTNKKTDVTKSEFEGNLEKSGYKKSTSKDGKVNIFTKDGKKYTTRNRAKEFDGPSADFNKGNSTRKKPDIKID